MSNPIITVREKDPDPLYAYQVPVDLSLPDEWSPLVSTPGHKMATRQEEGANELCFLNRSRWHYDCVSAGDWIVMDDEGRFSAWTAEQFDRWFEPAKLDEEES